MRRRILALLLLLGLASPAAAIEARPLLYSLLLPGLGEWSLGYRGRAAVQFAVEAGCWAGNFYYRDRGITLRHEYEAYAEAHWEEARWASAWSEEQPEWLYWVTPAEWEALGWTDGTKATAVAFDDTHPGYLESHFAPYHEDPQHYYENLGKYDWYRWGWDDYSTVSDDSAHRYVYLDMRKDSNAAFDHAEAFIFALVAARVVSLADTYILLRRLDRAGGDQAALAESWHLQFGPELARPAGFRLALTRSW